MAHLLEDIPQPENGFYVLVTGANSGVGLGIGCRLIDEFLQTRPQSESLVLIVTTRSKEKGDATVDSLRNHLKHACRKLERSVPGITMVLQRRVHFRQENLDLTSIVSVQKLAKRIRQTTPKLDAVILNAGIGGWTGLNLYRAATDFLSGWSSAVTWPTFKVAGLGWLTKPQISAAANNQMVEEPPLGEVFCANVFGHYLLGHYLAPLLARADGSDDVPGRLIWVGSLDAYDHAFSFEDFQGIRSHQPYEVSKRLTDLLAISSALPSVEPFVNKYLGLPHGPQKITKPRIYLSHPGICGTAIFDTWFQVIQWTMLLTFYIARWVGSQWHPITAIKGATAMVWLALARQSTLDSMEASEGVGKWGSATDWWGNERVERTEVEGWGWGGVIEESNRKRRGRSPYARDLTPEDREKFEEDAKRCWEEMERLREEWEQRLKDAGVAVEID